MISTQDIIFAARTLLNTPYKEKGRTPGRELDCLGVVILTGRIAGSFDSDFDYQKYSSLPNGALDRELDNHCLKLHGLTSGSIVTFRLASVAHHCGIITDYRGKFGLIHAYKNARAVREHELIPWWADKIDKVYGFPGVDYAS